MLQLPKQIHRKCTRMQQQNRSVYKGFWSINWFFFQFNEWPTSTHKSLNNNAISFYNSPVVLLKVYVLTFCCFFTKTAHFWSDLFWHVPCCQYHYIFFNNYQLFVNYLKLTAVRLVISRNGWAAVSLQWLSYSAFMEFFYIENLH